MPEELEIHLIDHAEIIPIDVPQLGIQAGSLAVWLRKGSVMIVRGIPVDEFRSATGWDPSSEQPPPGFLSVPNDDPDARFFDQVMDELERRWPDLLESWRRRHHG